MDKTSTVVIHRSPSLYNQILYAKYLLSGFERLGFDAEVSDNPHKEADIHVIIGPHYAFDQNLGKNTIYVDRCLWGDDLEYVTIGWLNNDGGMEYPKGCPGDRLKPEIKEWKKSDSDKAIFLLDYGPYPLELCHLAQKNYGFVTFRPHPATKKKQPDLLDHLKGHKVAIGKRSSALFTAFIEGYPVISFDSRSPVYSIAGHDILDIKYPDREQWLNDLSYSQWSAEEIQGGEALEYVLNYKAIQ